MRTNNINNNKVNENSNMTHKNLTKFYAKQLRKDCKKIINVVRNDKDENGKSLYYKQIAEREDFILAYRKAKFHFNQLVKAGEEGKKIAHVIFGKEAFEDATFRCVEGYFVALHPEDGGRFFNNLDYYDYTRKKSPEEKLQDKIAAENSASEAKREKAIVSNGRRNRRAIITIVILALITVAAIAVAMYKKGVKPVLKAIAFGACCVTVVFAFRKAQDAVLERIHKRFYGNNK